jgi:4-hydroxythreonine-4-phosphate dehydrogenase
VRRPRIALTPGDPLGIGPEVGVACAQRDDCELIALGDRELWERAAALRGVPVPTVRPVIGDEPPEIAAVRAAAEGCLDGTFDAMVTGPIHKASLLDQGFAFPGHTGYLAHLCGMDPADAVMLFAGGRLTVSLATVHVPLSQVPQRLTPAALLRAARAPLPLLARLGIARPRVALCGLNPHAGEDGKLGGEDAAVIAPAVATLRAEGVDATGPHPADTVFAHAAGGRYDLVVACYHDQGLIPVKTLDFGRSVNITAGLPIVRTSVDHGTARDIAWQGVAHAGHMAEAIDMAVKLAG